MFRKIFSPIASLILITTLVRCVIWIPHFAEIIQNRPLESHFRMIYEHAFESFFFQHISPPLSDIYNALTYNTLGVTLGYYFIVFSVISFSAIAAVYLYLTSRELGANTGISWILSLLYSLSMMRIDGAEWFMRDDLIYYLLPVFIFYLIKYFSAGKTSCGVTAAILAGLIIWTSSVPGLVSLVLFLLATIFMPSARSLKQRVLIFLIPFTFCILLCAKNYYNVGIFMVSSKGGWHNLFFIEQLHGWSPEKLIQYAKEEDAPEWWTWCAENRAMDWYETTGACYGKYKGEADLYRDGVNYEPLIQKLEAEGRPDLAEMARKDEWDTEHKPWKIYAGEAFAVGGRFNAQYVREGQKLWVKYWTKRTIKGLTRIFKNNIPSYTKKGPLFGLKDRNGMIMIVGPESFNKFLKGVTWLNAFFLWLAEAVVLTRIFWLIFRWGKAFLKNIFKPRQIVPAMAATLYPVDFLCIGFFLSFLITVLGSCCMDIDRMFWLSTTYLVPIAAYTVTAGFAFIGRLKAGTV